MSLSLLYSPPSSEADWRAWAFNHAALHYVTLNAINAQKGFNLTQFPLYPLNQDDLALWLYQHQQMHNEANGVLRLNSYDLLALDLTNEDQATLWLQQNGLEHEQWTTILGV